MVGAETPDSPPGDVGAWTEAYGSPELRGAGEEVAGRTLTFGHLVLQLRAGRLCAVVAGGRVVGAYLHGIGTFRFTAADPSEVATFRTNAGSSSHYDVDSRGSIADTFEDVLVYVSSGADTLGGEGWLDGTASPGAVAAFGRHLERWSQDQGWRAAQVMPQAQIEQPDEPVVLAEIAASRDDLVYLYDTLRTHDESIAVERKLKHTVAFLADRRYPEVLSTQPVGRARPEPRPTRALLTDVDVTLVNSEGLTASLEVTETFRATAPIRTLDLDLWSRRIGTVGLNGTWTEHAYTLSSVTTADGGAVAWAHVNGDLVVQLPRTLQPGESVGLRFEIGGDVLYNPNNDSYWELPTSSWLPLPELEEQYFRYHAVIKVAKPFQPFSSGATVRRWQEGDMECAEFREERPIQIPVVLAGKYKTVSEEKDGVTVSVSSYVMSNERSAKRLINNAFALMEFYKVFMGPYPFKELKILEINSYGFGQAPAGVIFLTKEAFSPLQDDVSRLFSQGVNGRLAHEMAHTWWGHVAKLGEPEDQWLSESTAEYMAAYAMGEIRRPAEFKKALRGWKEQARYVTDTGSVYLANELSGEDAPQERYRLLYARGPLMLQALRQKVGDDTFFTILKSFLHSFDFKLAQTRHFIGLTNFVTKKDMTPFFDDYLMGTKTP